MFEIINTFKNLFFSEKAHINIDYKKDSSFSGVFDLPFEEQNKMWRDAVTKANKEQRDMVERNKDKIKLITLDDIRK